MTIIYLPVYKIPVGYLVSFGRRWSILEHIILTKLAADRCGVTKLAQLSNLPERLIVESLINLLRSGWIEVRTTDEGAIFSVTKSGLRRVGEETLPADLRQRIKWISLCYERLTGSWMRSDDLDLVHDKELPDGAVLIEPRFSTFSSDDESRRGLVYLERDESFEKFVQIGRAPVRTYARLEVVFNQVQKLPAYASSSLRNAILDETPVSEISVVQDEKKRKASTPNSQGARDTFGPEDLIIGGAEHSALVSEALENAKSHMVIHSCFVHPKAIAHLMPKFEAAARRNVKIDLLWGDRNDPEESENVPPLSATLEILKGLSSEARQLVQLSPVSSGSHSKILLFDELNSENWTTVIGSCNWLSADYSAIEVSLRSRSRRLSSEVLSQILAAQIPSSGNWTPVVHRLNRIWNQLRPRLGDLAEAGDHSIELMVDADHYACLRAARDEAEKYIAIGCDIFGASAETAVLPPMHTAAEHGAKVDLFYKRPSKFLETTGRLPNIQELKKLGISLKLAEKLHGKFMIWDSNAIAITSFNWLATIADKSRSRGAEIGVLIRGPNLGSSMKSKLLGASEGDITI